MAAGDAQIIAQAVTQLGKLMGADTINAIKSDLDGKADLVGGNDFSGDQSGKFLDRGGAVYNSALFASLDAMVTEIGATQATILLAPGDTKTLTGNLTIPANVTLSGQMGVIATNGFTLTVNGPCPVVDYQVFDVSGGGSVVGLAECTPRMFGAIGNDTGADDLPPMQAAVNAVKDRGGTVHVRRGTYTLGDGTTISAQLFLYSGVTLRGDGRGITTIKSNKLIEASDGSAGHRTRAPLIRSESWRDTTGDIVENITVEGISFEGQRTNESYSPDYEYYAIIAVSGIRHATFRDLSFKNVYGDGLNIGPSHLLATEPDFNRDITVENIYIENCLRGGVTCVSGVGIRIRNVEGTGEGAPIHLEPGQSAPYGTLKDVHVTDFNLHDGSNWPPIWVAAGNSGPDYLAGITIENGVIRDWSNTGSGWDYFMLFGAAGGTFRNVKFYDCVTDAPIFFRAAGSRIDIEGCEWWNCSMEGANAAVFWQQFVYPTTGDDSAADAAGFRWNGNKAFGCVNTLGFSGASPVVNSRFFGFRDDGNGGTLFTNNTVYCGGFYHGTVADEEGVLQFGNIIVADSNLVQGSDPNAGQRGIYTAGASGAAIILGNIVLGWATPIHNASAHPQIGHNYGVVYHQGFTATGAIS